MFHLPCRLDDGFLVVSGHYGEPHSGVSPPQVQEEGGDGGVVGGVGGGVGGVGGVGVAAQAGEQALLERGGEGKFVSLLRIKQDQQKQQQQ